MLGDGLEGGLGHVVLHVLHVGAARGGGFSCKAVSTFCWPSQAVEQNVDDVGDGGLQGYCWEAVVRVAFGVRERCYAGFVERYVSRRNLRGLSPLDC